MVKPNYLLFYIFSIILLNTITNAQELDFFEPKTTIGGYGELHYNYMKTDPSEATKKLDFHRFVLFFGHSFSEEWSFKAELELEHNYVAEGQGELELEQAYVNYHHAEYLGFQAGVVLPSVGLINEYHEPPLFFGVERPDYHKNIIPTTWFGNGVAIYGFIEGFDYKVVIMEGLDADNFKAASGIRGGRQKGFEANAENLLYNFRLDYLNIPGLKVGVSFTTNKAMGDSIDIPLNLIELHTQYHNKNFYGVFEYGNISYDNQEIKTSRGYYIDLGYNIGSLLNIKTQIIPFIRYSDFNTAAETISGGDLEKQYHIKQWIVGASVKPIENIVFKVDYGINNQELGDTETTLINLGVGYMF